MFAQLGMDWIDKPKEWISSFNIPIVWAVIYLLFVKQVTAYKREHCFSCYKWSVKCFMVFDFFTLNQLLFGNIIIIINALFALRLYFEICKQDANIQFCFV